MARKQIRHILQVLALHETNAFILTLSVPHFFRLWQKSVFGTILV